MHREQDAFLKWGVGCSVEDFSDDRSGDSHRGFKRYSLPFCISSNNQVTLSLVDVQTAMPVSAYKENLACNGLLVFLIRSKQKKVRRWKYNGTGYRNNLILPLHRYINY